METQKYIEALFSQQKISVNQNRLSLFEEFANDAENINSVGLIKENQRMITDRWILKNKIQDIKEKNIPFPNGTEKVLYEFKIDFKKYGLTDIILIEFEGLEENGLVYFNDIDTIKGTPEKSGDVKIKMKFRVTGEDENSILNEKWLSFYVNPDPKSLWNNIESNKDDPFWKSDNVSVFDNSGNEKMIVVSSKRGRSHANVGSFRDDDFAYKHFEKTGWSIVCVADGAGSSKLARQGSKIACEAVIEYFSVNFSNEQETTIGELALKYIACIGKENQKTQSITSKEPDSNIDSNQTSENPIPEEIAIDNIDENKTDSNSVIAIENINAEIKLFLYNSLGKAAFDVHKQIERFATANGNQLKDYNSTLIFTLFKKFDFGYCILSFGVGDCPIAVINKDQTESYLLNWLDVGEFGGGTRFITMPEIFKNENFYTRLSFKIIDDFSYLILMTDGIYDPKFIVESNLEKVEKWNEFISDLQGENEDKIVVDFSHENKGIANQLSNWMDFWSSGNHDDRTLAIIF